MQTISTVSEIYIFGLCIHLLKLYCVLPFPALVVDCGIQFVHIASFIAVHSFASITICSLIRRQNVSSSGCGQLRQRLHGVGSWCV